MNDCSGHGTASSTTGQCTCDTGYKGGDCSLENTVLSTSTDATIAHEGPKYFSLTVFGSSSLRLQSSNVEMDVYVSKGIESDPSQFDFNAAFKGVQDLTLDSSKNLFLAAGYVVTVYIAAVDEYSNTLISNGFHYSFTANADQEIEL